MLFKEFFEQGDNESKNGLEISPLCDRNTLHIPDSQISEFLSTFISWFKTLILAFNKYIIEPTFNTLTNLFYVINEDLARAWK
jgi:hypothetical protein